MLTTPSTVASLNGELRDAGETLVGNDDVLRAVLAGCGDCIKILDLDGRLQFMSEGGKRVMEVDDFAALKGCPWPDFWAGEGNASAIEAVAVARQGKTAQFHGEANTARGNPKYWDVHVSPILGSDGSPTHLLSISRDVTAARLAEIRLMESAKRQRLIAVEMSHRMNNTLALIGAIASQTMRGNDLEGARIAFASRLRALADANKLLLDNDLGSTPVSVVVENALSPHLPPLDRVKATGPVIELPPKQAMSLALALHEMATNSAKYGALSNETGTIEVVWDVEATADGREFSFRWAESGGPPIANSTPTRKGFGSRLIQGVLAQDFGGKVQTSFESAGFVCELRSPLDAMISDYV